MMRKRQSITAWILGVTTLVTLGLFGTVGSVQGDDGLASPVAQGVRAEAMPAASAKAIRAFLPLVTYNEPTTTLPFRDGFDEGVSSDWVVFENYPGPSKDDWYWHDWGWYIYDPCGDSGWGGYALSMYLGPGSEDWTDYTAVTTIRDRREKIAGMWVRGSYENLGDGSGGRVGGYYVFIKPKNDAVYLFEIRDSGLYYDLQERAAIRYTPGIGTKTWYNLKVQVQGANIRVWLKDSLDPESAYVQLINWTDPDGSYMKGTVGFVTYGCVENTNVIYDSIEVTE